MTLEGIVATAAGVAADEAVRLARIGDLGDLGQVEQYIGAALTKFFEQQGPGLASKLAMYLEPATAKAVEVIKPSVMQALKDYTPTFAAVAGGMIGIAYLIGHHIARREIRKGARR